MSLQGLLFRLGAGSGDRKRNNATAHPAGVICFSDIPYGSHGKDQLLNVYLPEHTTEALPTIVSIHGGGYVYGDKEVYHHYCADLARRGFAVVNFNYRLAPKWKFPTPLLDTNKVMQWLVLQAGNYYMDPQRLFLVGDSAGAQLASQYAAIASNPEYAKGFFEVPAIRIRAVGLNCGMYDVKTMLQGKIGGIEKDYFGAPNPIDPRYDVLGAVTASYPPAHITTAHYDFLRANAVPMYDFLREKGVDCAFKCYGSEDKKHIAHVFHVDIRNEEATLCNDEQTEFFRRYL